MQISTSIGIPDDASSGGFSPVQIGTMVLWLRADLGVSLSGTLRATGTAPPVVTISGAAATTVALRLEITTPGTLTNALFRWSTDAGVTFQQANVATAATVLLGSTGITVLFPAGTYSADNVYQGVLANWADQSGQGNNAVQVTESRRNVLSFSAFPAKPSVSIDANINGIIECDAIAASFSGLNKPCSVIAAVKVNDNTRPSSLLAFGDVGPAEMRYELCNGATHKLRCQRAPDAGGLTTVTTTDDQVTTPEFVSFIYTGTQISVFLNGVATSLSNTALATAACTQTLASIGGTPAFGDIGIFDVAELLVYASALSTADRQRAETYVKNHNGL